MFLYNKLYKYIWRYYKWKKIIKNNGKEKKKCMKLSQIHDLILIKIETLEFLWINENSNNSSTK